MSLRNRQVGGIPLNRMEGVLFTFFGAVVVWVLSINVWIPLFGYYLFRIPQELVGYIAYGGALLYVSGCDWGVVPQGKERSQLLFGIPTGVSFSAGSYVLPKIPFPIVVLLVKLCANNEVSSYLGWTLQGDVGIASITVNVDVEGITSDGYRVTLSVPLIFEVGDATVYLAQTTEGTTNVYEAISSESSSRIKQMIVARHTVLELHRGTLTNGDTVSELISEVCSFIQEYGLYLRRNPIVKVTMLNKQVERLFDKENAWALIVRQAIANGVALKDLQAQHPEMDTLEGMMFYSQIMGELDGVQRFNVNNIRIK